MSDGEPTDDFESGLNLLQQNNWFKHAIKVAVASTVLSVYKTLLSLVIETVPVKPFHSRSLGNTSGSVLSSLPEAYKPSTVIVQSESVETAKSVLSFLLMTISTLKALN